MKKNRTNVSKKESCNNVLNNKNNVTQRKLYSQNIQCPVNIINK